MVPVERVGLYVPGGIAPLVSSVVMNVVPAQVAGVSSIALTSSPQREHGGLPHPTILAACALLGIDEVYAVGGAQAIAMFAYGAGPCRRVDLVTGPGNIYTVSAKRLLKGVVGIDAEAGPTEIAVLADDTADPAYVAADLISQAEHDPLAASVLVTPSERLADEVEAELDKQVSVTRHVERIRAALAGRQSGIVLVDDLDQGLDVVNAYAAEHLEIQTADAVGGRRAGCATPARSSSARSRPVSLGDYCAGSNHVLPTAGCACHSSGLSVRAFLKAVHVVDYTRDALAEVADHVVTLADAEDLPGHGAAVRVRFDRLRPDDPDERGRRCARSCAACSRTAPRSSTCRSSSTSTRTPTRRRPRVVADVATAVAEATTTLNRYPDREFAELRDRPRRLPRPRRHAPTRSGRPTAPTR